MKSKTSFFNLTIFKKNIFLYWPIWGSYTLLLLLMLPLQLWMNCRNTLDDYYLMGITWEEMQFNILRWSMDMRPYIGLVFVVALILAGALFYYLYSAKSANMIHSLPVTREELFGTNYLSGLVLLIVPQFLTFLISVLISLYYEITHVEYFGYWFLLIAGVSVFAYSMACFCAMLVGHIVSLPFVYVAINFLYLLVKVIICGLTTFFGYGLYFEDTWNRMGFEWLSPITYMTSRVNIITIFDETPKGISPRMEVYGENVVALYLIGALIFVVLAYLLYRKRHLELAGDFVAVPSAKPVFRWGFGMIGGFGLGSLIALFLCELNFYVNGIGMLICILICGVILFFISEMLLKKNFKVFRKKKILECFVFLVCTIFVFVAILITIRVMEKKVPNKDEIESVEVDMFLPMTYRGDEIDEIIAIHEQIIEQKDAFADCNSYMGYLWEESHYMDISYRLKDGTTLLRSYCIPYDDVGKTIVDQMYERISTPEGFLDGMFGGDYLEMEYTGGYFEQYDENDDYIHSVTFTQSDVEAIQKAIVDDAKAGVLQKYNIYYITEDKEPINMCTSGIYIDYYDPNFQDENMYDEFSNVTYDGFDYVMYEGYASSTYIEFGIDCENIIQTLLDLEIIDSVEDLEFED